MGTSSESYIPAICRVLIAVLAEVKQALAVQGFAQWWNRGESNPRPKALERKILRAQTVIFA